MVRVAVIGCGKIAQVRHLPEYAANPDCELVGCFDNNTARAQEIAAQYGCKAYGSVQELLDDESIDAVSVLTSNDTHAEVAIAALQAGKQVLCEKPMAVSLEQCEAMVAASKSTGNLLMLAHNQRFNKAHAKARELVRAGVIGDVLTFRTTFGHSGADNWSVDGKTSWFFDKSKAIFGAMGDLGIHKTDLVIFLTGQRVSEVTAVVGTIHKKDAAGNALQVDDNATCIYRMDGGAVGTMTASWTFYGKEDNSTVLYGSKGIMSIYGDDEHSIVIHHADGTRTLLDLDRMMTNDEQLASGVIDEFVRCVGAGESPEITGDEAIHAMKAIFAAMESSEKGCTVQV